MRSVGFFVLGMFDITVSPILTDSQTVWKWAVLLFFFLSVDSGCEVLLMMDMLSLLMSVVPSMVTPIILRFHLSPLRASISAFTATHSVPETLLYIVA